MSLANKYRPSTIDDVVGQNHITQIITNLINTPSSELHKTYLFSGLHGTGKTSLARLFAITYNCETKSACGKCNSCTNSIYYMREIDVASNNSVSDVRELVTNVNMPTQVGLIKFFILDEAHMYTESAFAAFLKTLESSRAIIIMCTTESHKIPLPNKSRAQQHHFKSIDEQDCINRLKYICSKENISITDDSLSLIYNHSNGSMRNAIISLEKLYNSHGSLITYENVSNEFNLINDEYISKIIETLLESNYKGLYAILETLYLEGNKPYTICEHILMNFRNTLFFDEKNSNFSKYSNYNEFILNSISVMNECLNIIKTHRNQKLCLELNLIKTSTYDIQQFS